LLYRLKQFDPFLIRQGHPIKQQLARRPDLKPEDKNKKSQNVSSPHI
jgi:hypothetical protein